MTDGPNPIPALRQVSRDTLQDQVYRQIREALMSGRFQPGQKLTIRGLAEALGSSPMPVREALQRLSAENAFEVTETSRLRVRMMTVERLREIRDARVALEGLLAEKAVLFLNKVDLDEITDLCQQMQKAADRSRCVPLPVDQLRLPPADLRRGPGRTDHGRRGEFLAAHGTVLRPGRPR